MRLLRRQAIPAGSLRPLLLLTFGFLVAGAAVAGWIQRPKDLEGVLIWFAAAIVGHDLVLLPVYSLMDRITLGWLPNGAAPYIRVPALVSGLVLLVLFPTILGFGAHTFHNASGLTEHGYLVRWLLLTAALFGLSAAAATYRGWRARSR